MSDLSQALVDAAAEAMAVIKATSQGSHERDAQVAVAAVLETLAAHCDPVAIGDGGASQALLSNTELRQLAAEARTES